MVGGPFRKIYPNQETIVFDGGLDNKYPAALIPDNESPDCLNVIFTNGAVQTRDGAVLLNTTPCGTGVVFDGLYSRRDNTGTNETMVAFAGGHMFTLNATTFITVPSAQSVFTAGNRVACDFQENYMFIGNGGIDPYKWDGSVFSRMGVPAPTATAAVASNGAGSLASSGQYQYAYTYVNSALVEGNMSPFTATFTVTSTGGGLQVTTIGAAPTSFGVARRRLYRTTNGGATFERVAELADNTTTTYNDTTADASLGVAAPLTNGVPPKFSALIYHAGRTFTNDPSNPNVVWYSELGQPYTFRPTNFFKVGDNTTDIVRGFGVYDNSVCVTCDQSIWINFMGSAGDPTTWQQIKSLSPYGSKSPFSVINVGVEESNQLLFPAMQNRKFVGFALASGNTLQPTNTILPAVATGSELQSDRIESDMFSVQESFVRNISALVFKNKAYISLTWGSGNQTNNRIYIFDFSLSNLKKSQPYSWVPWTGLSATQFCVYSGKLYFASADTSGSVFNIDGTGVYSDNGSAINSYFWTKEFPGFSQDTNFMKDWRYANILLDTSGNYYMNVRYRGDSDKGVGNVQNINLNPGGSNWGTMVWGRDSWGGGSNQIEPRIFLGSMRAKRLQLQFSNQNTAGQSFKVHRMNLAYNVKGYR